MHHVIITGPAKRDIQAAHDWWAENRSADQAVRWYVGIHKAIYSLKQMPTRCSLAPEGDLLEQGIRQLLFGLGRRPTHRIVFVVDSSLAIHAAVEHQLRPLCTLQASQARAPIRGPAVKRLQTKICRDEAMTREI